jgi:MoaA/NifB/PqqE/SkfB family radical SAM enzyme
VHPAGIVKPCCMSNKEYETDSGNKYLSQSSIMEFWKSRDRQKMIEDLDSGKKIKECQSCWKEEDAGRQSKRIRDNEEFKDRLLSENMLPIVADFSLGNLCNLKCRICKPIHSSQWMIEEAKHYEHGRQIYLNHPIWATVKQSFDASNDLFWNDIINLLPNVEKFDFAGGEPFYIEKHWDIIEKCVENGWSKNQHIHYNTNGTIFPEKYLHLLEKFKVVDIQVSTDGIDKKFEYLRDPADWSEVENNIEKFLNTIKNSETEWRFSMCLSVSAFNVYDFFETYEYYSRQGIGIYVNVVHDNSSMSVLPDDIKIKIVDHLMSFTEFSSDRWMTERDIVCSYLKNSNFDKEKWNLFKEKLFKLDRIRNQSFEQVFPEYYNILKEYL